MNREIACILQSMGFHAAWMVAATVFIVGLLCLILKPTKPTLFNALLPGLLSVVIMALFVWVMDLQMEIRALKSMVQAEQQRRLKNAELAKQWEDQAKTWHRSAMDCAEVSNGWETTAKEFREVVKKYERMLGARSNP